MLITVPSTSEFERKLYSSLVLKILTEKSAKQETRVYSCVELCRMEKLEAEKSRFYAQKP
jgi:hypothetical protein